MKLHVGCGRKKLDGFEGVDIRPLPGVKYVCNMWEIPVQRGTVDVIYCRHALEHVDYEHARETLDEFCILLKARGHLELIVPNLEFHAKQLLGMVTSGHKAGEIRHALAGFHGWQDGGEESIHRSGWTAKLLRTALADAGFDDIEIPSYFGPHLTAIARPEKA